MKKDYSQGVAVFIIKENKILLTKRIKGGFTGFWEVPAGHIKNNESIEDTAIREVKEETSLVVNSIKVFGINVNEEYKFQANLVTTLITSGTAKNIDTYNHSALKWFSIDKLPSPLGESTLKGLKILKII